MHLKRDRFSELSHEEAIALLNKLEGPWLEIALSGVSADCTSSDVLAEVMLALQNDPSFSVLFPTDDEWEAWERFKAERGDGAKKIGEFVYGTDENPWR